MAIPLSDNIIYKSPKSAQEFRRKVVSPGVETDWANTAEIDTFFANTAGLDPSFKNNKDFWVDGVLYNYDGTEYRVVGGGVEGAAFALKYRILTDSQTVTIPALIGCDLMTGTYANQTFDSDTLLLDPLTGEIDGSAIGGFAAGYLLTITFIKL
jgi:hypothetical protein